MSTQRIAAVAAGGIPDRTGSEHPWPPRCKPRPGTLDHRIALLPARA